MTSIQHEHTVGSRVREAVRLTTARITDIEYRQFASAEGKEVDTLRAEVELLNSIAHELLEALALM